MRGSAPARGINCRPASGTAPHCRSLSPSRAWRRYCCRLPQRRNRQEKFRHCLASNRSRRTELPRGPRLRQRPKTVARRRQIPTRIRPLRRGVAKDAARPWNRQLRQAEKAHSPAKALSAAPTIVPAALFAPKSLASAQARTSPSRREVHVECQLISYAKRRYELRF